MRCRIGLLTALLMLPAAVYAEDSRLDAHAADGRLFEVEMAISAGRVTQAQSMLHALEQQLPEEFQPRRTLLLAELHMVTGDSKASEEALAKVPEGIADQCRYGGIAGWLAYQDRNWNRAIAMLAKSVRACPDDPGRWNLLGLALVQKNETSAALEAFDQALAFAPHNPSLLNNRALAYAYAGRTDAALADLELAASIENETGIMANLSALRANAGLAATLESSQDSQTQSIILAKAGDGAIAADRHVAARSYYARALLQSEQFDMELWTRATAPTSEPPSEDRDAIP